MLDLYLAGRLDSPDLNIQQWYDDIKPYTGKWKILSLLQESFGYSCSLVNKNGTKSDL